MKQSINTTEFIDFIVEYTTLDDDGVLMCRLTYGPKTTPNEVRASFMAEEWGVGVRITRIFKECV